MIGKEINSPHDLLTNVLTVQVPVSLAKRRLKRLVRLRNEYPLMSSDFDAAIVNRAIKTTNADLRRSQKI